MKECPCVAQVKPNVSVTQVVVRQGLQKIGHVDLHAFGAHAGACMLERIFAQVGDGVPQYLQDLPETGFSSASALAGVAL